MAERVASPVDLTREDRDLVTLAQARFPLVRRPFAALGDAISRSEGFVIERLAPLKQAGIIRKIGPVFEPDRLGLVTELVAVEANPSDLEAVGAAVADWSPVTHCYAREHEVNLWFAAVAADTDWFEEAAARVARFPGVSGVWRLPALRRFKIAVRFHLSDPPTQVDAAATAADSVPSGAIRAAPHACSSATIDAKLLSVVQSDLPLRPDPFALLASPAGVDAENLLAVLRQWVEEGAVRRYGALVNHRRLGFVANGMTVWHVSEEEVEMVGSRLAHSPHVSHCYERPAFPRFPFNLYAMVHARSQPECLSVIEDLSPHCGQSERAVLFSTREFKKSAPDYARLLARRSGGRSGG